MILSGSVIPMVAVGCIGPAFGGMPSAPSTRTHKINAAANTKDGPAALALLRLFFPSILRLSVVFQRFLIPLSVLHVYHLSVCMSVQGNKPTVCC